jgi:hypothetical protein
MKAHGCSLVLSTLVCFGGAVLEAQAQTPAKPVPAALEPVPLSPADGRLEPLLPSPGSRTGDWQVRGEQPVAYKPQWQGSKDEWDVSGAVNFIEESRANAVDFQTGGLFETEGAVVRRFGNIRVGAVAYTARSVGDKAGRGPKLGAMKWQGSAAGPIVGYDATVAGRPATVSLRWYREIDTPGEEGDTVSASFAVRF